MPFELKYDIEHFKRVESLYIRQLQQLYISATREAANIASLYGDNVDSSRPLDFRDYPRIQKRIDKLIESFGQSFKGVVTEGIERERLESAKKNDALVNRVLKSTPFKRDQVEHLYNRNLESLAAFQKRKEGGLNLSDRVWKYTNQFKGELEMGLDVGLSDGRSAAELSRDLRSYLQNPDKLFRRVRNLRGELVLSQNAKKYHPGPGVYRSSAKNALRLTRTEVNMAYRESDFERWQQLDFVVGIEVHRSNNLYACKLCDTLVGRYPKDFKFRGWHTSCRCYTITILSSIDEFIEREKKYLAGEDPGEFHSVNEIKNVPTGYINWVNDNKEKIIAAKNKPYFIKDNLQYSSYK